MKEQFGHRSPWWPGLLVACVVPVVGPVAAALLALVLNTLADHAVRIDERQNRRWLRDGAVTWVPALARIQIMAIRHSTCHRSDERGRGLHEEASRTTPQSRWRNP